MTRGTSNAFMRNAECKDCRREVNHGTRPADQVKFVYNEAWATQQIERGGSRSDRCREHRLAHRKHMQGMAVAYIDLETVGSAIGSDDKVIGPTGPLGGLGPLPGGHELEATSANLEEFGFGMDETHIREMLDYLQNDDQRVLVVKAGTGTGKSTYMPMRLLDPPAGCFRLADLGRIVVTEPRVQATTGVAGYVGKKLSGAGGVGPGYPVGYQVSTDRNHDAACQLIYVTDGTVINWMREGRLSEVGTIIVDEAHERSTNIDFIMGFLKQNIDRYPHLRVIVTSATFNADFYVEYFGGTTPGDGSRSPVNKVIVPAQKSIGYGCPLFPELDVLSPEEAGDAKIAKGWADACPELPIASVLDETAFIATHWTTQFADPLTADDVTGELVGEIGSQEDLHDTTQKLLGLRFQGPLIPPKQWKTAMPKLVGTYVTELVNGLDRAEIYGDVLAFLPTTDAIETAKAIIEPALGDRATVFALISTLSTEKKDAALEARRKGDVRKVVLSSNLAETSLTVEGVRFVVDSGLICQQTWNPESASGSLPTVPHSRSGIKQRWGRVGRKAPGWVFPLYSKAQFAGLDEDTPPGSTRSNLESLVMTAKMGGIDDVVAFPWPASFVPKRVTLDDAAETAREVFRAELVRADAALKQSGAIDLAGHPTSFGKELTRFQALDSTAAAIAIMYADRLGCVPEVATLLAVLRNSLTGVRGILADSEDWPPEWRLEAVERHEAVFSACEDDADAVLQLVAAWERSDPEAPPWIDTPARAEYARELWLNHDRLIEMAEKRRAILESLSPAMKEEVKRFVEPSLLKRARGVVTRAMGGLEYRREHGNSFYPIDSPDTPVGVLSGSLVPSVPDRIIPLARYRDSQTGTHSLSNVLAVEPWAEPARCDTNRSGPADAIALLVAAAKHGSPDTRKDVLGALVLAWAPGTRMRLTFITEQGIRRARVERVVAPASLPLAVANEEVDLTDEGEVADADPGVDTGWPAPNEPIEDEDNLERRRVVDTRPFEADADACGECDQCRAGESVHCTHRLERSGADAAIDVLEAWTARASLKVDVTMPRAVVDGSDPVDGEWYEVAGYEVDGEEPAVVFRRDWRPAGRPYGPGEHSDLEPGQPVEVRVGESRMGIRILHRVDGRGRFALREADSRPQKQEESGQVALSLNRRGGGLAAALVPGAQMRCTVLPRKEPSCSTVSLLELLHQHVLAAHRLQLRLDGASPRGELRLPATVLAQPNAAGYVTARLDVADPERGIVHDFAFPAADVLSNLDDVEGLRIWLPLRPAGARLSLAGIPLAPVDELATRFNGDLRASYTESQGVGAADDAIVSRRPISGAVARELERLRADEAWRADVWNFFARSHHLNVNTNTPFELCEVESPALAAELVVAERNLEDALAEIPFGATVTGRVVDVDIDGPVVNITPLVSVIVAEQDRNDRSYSVGDEVAGLIRDVRPRWGELRLDLSAAYTAEARVAPSVESITRINRRRLEGILGVEISISGRPAVLRIDAPSQEALDQAVAELATYLNAHSVAVDVPRDLKRQVLGEGRHRLRSLQRSRGILHCNFGRDDDEYRLLIGAETAEDLAGLLEDLERILSSEPDVVARMVVPSNKNRALIGKGGAKVNDLRHRSGCTYASAIDNGPVWIVEGPSQAHIDHFVKLANELVPGCRLEG